MAHFLRVIGDRLHLSGTAFPRVCTILLVLALAATLTGWVLEFSARRTPAEPVRAVPLGNPAPRTQAEEIAPIARLLGALPGTDGSDIKLVGVIAQGRQGQGIALLAVDGRPALPLRAGEEIAAGVTLAEVRADRVVVSRSGAVQEIRLPAKPAPDGIVKVPN
ncbi:MAG TPA: type II secretion system protein N [Burkholderiales bacterium]|nr:type II secretion system protein N [Burkholderiales bacterium]